MTVLKASKNVKPAALGQNSQHACTKRGRLFAKKKKKKKNVGDCLLFNHTGRKSPKLTQKKTNVRTQATASACTAVRRATGNLTSSDCGTPASSQSCCRVPAYAGCELRKAKPIPVENKKSTTSSSKWDGTISSDEFRRGAHAFADKWKIVCKTYKHDLPLWSWVSCFNSSFCNFHEIDGETALHALEEEPDCLETTEDCTDPAMLVQQAAEDVHYYDFHIVYSSSYRIPVLYFRGYKSDGQTLTLDQIERDLPPSSVEVLAEAKWTFITQQEHPYLNRPWYTLHPCGTSELMKLLQSNTPPEDKVGGDSYFISWLSVVSQVVGLKMPLQMAVVLAIPPHPLKEAGLLRFQAPKLL